MLRRTVLVIGVIAGSIGLSSTPVDAHHASGADGLTVPTYAALGDGLDTGYDCVPEPVAVVWVDNVGNGAGVFSAEVNGQSTSAILEPGDAQFLYLDWIVDGAPSVPLTVKVDGAVVRESSIHVDCGGDGGEPPTDLRARTREPAPKFAYAGEGRGARLTPAGTADTPLV